MYSVQIADYCVVLKIWTPVLVVALVGWLRLVGRRGWRGPCFLLTQRDLH